MQKIINVQQYKMVNVMIQVLVETKNYVEIKIVLIVIFNVSILLVCVCVYVVFSSFVMREKGRENGNERQVEGKAQKHTPSFNKERTREQALYLPAKHNNRSEAKQKKDQSEERSRVFFPLQVE